MFSIVYTTHKLCNNFIPYFQPLIDAGVVENVETLVRSCNHLIREKSFSANSTLSKNY